MPYTSLKSPFQELTTSSDLVYTAYPRPQMPLYPPTHVTPPMVDAELCIHDSSINKTVETDGNKVNNDIHCIHCDKQTRTPKG
jgi:hypothetical protein